MNDHATKPFTPAQTLKSPWTFIALNLWLRRLKEGARKERKWAFPTRRERKSMKMLARLRDDDF